LSSDNGCVIGRPNIPTVLVASGVWRPSFIARCKSAAGIAAGLHWPVYALTGTYWDTTFNATGEFTYSNGNRAVVCFSSGSGHARARATTTHATTGKYYLEFGIDGTASGGDPYVGLCSSTPGNGTGAGLLVANQGWLQSAGGSVGSQYQLDNATAYQVYATPFVVGDVCGMAVDFAAAKIWWSRNNVWINSGNPGAGTGANFADIAGTLYPCVVAGVNGAGVTLRCIATDLTYTPPTGFSAWG